MCSDMLYLCSLVDCCSQTALRCHTQTLPQLGIHHRHFEAAIKQNYGMDECARDRDKRERGRGREREKQRESGEGRFRTYLLKSMLLKVTEKLQ